MKLQPGHQPAEVTAVLRALGPDPKQPGSVDLRLVYEARVPAGVGVAQARKAGLPR